MRFNQTDIKRLKRKARSRKGASIALAAAFIFVCILLIYFGFQMSVLMGGSRQVRNAVDAAVLNVGKRVVETKVDVNSKYSDVADSKGKVGLSNINRVWGKTLLINANAKEMKKQGFDSKYEGNRNAHLSYQLAKQMNNRLVDKLQDKTTLNMFFRHTGNQRGAALLGSEAKLDTEKRARYQIAMVGRGDESNLKFNQSQLPEGTEVGAVCVGKSSYMQGYQSFQVNGKPFMFTTFHRGETPHLISDNTFEKCKPTITPLGDFPNAVPNSWQASGLVSGKNGSMRATASAVANPQRTFDLAIPYGFVYIQVDNLSFWYVEGQLSKVIRYKENKQYHGLVNAQFKDMSEFNGYAVLGNEYKNPSLKAYIDVLPGDKTEMIDRITQRLKEVDEDFTKEQLVKLLKKVTPNPAVSRYYIYPAYSTPDRSDPQIVISSDISGNLPAWIDPTTDVPEGDSKPIIQEKTLFGEPATHWAVANTGPTPTSATKFTGTINWKPGTGYDKCLGEIRMARVTKLNFVPAGNNPNNF